MNNLIGKDLGRYHILEKLGEGGMATVYKAYDTRLESDVAVKVIRTDMFPPTALERVLKRFEREAKALARLNHPNIVSVLDYGEHDGAPYLVMKYMPGGTLKDRLGQPLPYRKAAWLVAPVARALAYAHQLGILHRDVKPSNILITQSGEPVLTDFGIAKLLDTAEGQTLTGTGLGVGTPEYMAPEQGLGKAIDGRADVYALGIVFYELVTGRKPYTADTPMAVVLKQVTEPLPRPRDYAPDLPESVEKVLFKALAKHPEDRYPDMAGLARALEGLAAAPGQEQLRPAIALMPAPREAAPLPDPNATWDELATPPPVRTRPDSPAQPVRQKPTFPRLLGWVGAAVVGLLLLIGLISGVILPAVERGHAEATMQAQTAAAQVTADRDTAIAAVWTPTPSKTPIPSKTPTPKATLTPTMGIISTQLREKDGMEMVYVPAEDFIMGSQSGDSNADSDEFPQDTIYLDAYWIDKYEVTNAQYRMCVEDGECDPPNDTGYYADGQYADHPVVYVSWYDARDYCAWAGERLPTEAEWEKAARGTDGRVYPWGDKFDSSYANVDDETQLDDYTVNCGSNGCDGYERTSPVGSYPVGASPYGTLDMAGNVWEWTSSRYQDYPYDSKNGREDPDASGARVLRGGSWSNSEWYVRAAGRLRSSPDLTSSDDGFRCVASQ